MAGFFESLFSAPPQIWAGNPEQLDLDTKLAKQRGRVVLDESLRNMGYDPDTAEEMSRAAITGQDNMSGLIGDIESKYGTLESKPSWTSAEERASAVRKRSGDDFNAYWKHLPTQMSPERYEYMQGPGRTVDLLRGLKDNPDRAMMYWDMSKENPDSRDNVSGPNNANYQRFAGFGRGAANFMSDTLNGPRWYLAHAANVIPDTAANSSYGGEDGSAMQRVAERQHFREVYPGVTGYKALSENPVGIHAPPVDTSNMSIMGQMKLRDEQNDRPGDLEQLAHDLQPPSYHHVLNKAVGVNTPPALAIPFGIAVDAMDGGMVGDLATNLGRWATGRPSQNVLQWLLQQGSSEIPTGVPAQTAANMSPGMFSPQPSQEQMEFAEDPLAEQRVMRAPDKAAAILRTGPESSYDANWRHSPEWWPALNRGLEYLGGGTGL